MSSIGEALARARRDANVTVTEVSQRTRIRETIIRGIESDDYSACGGDFYARGHIRAIARVVGLDPEPLIRQYDAARQPPPAAPSATSRPTTGSAVSGPAPGSAVSGPAVSESAAQPAVSEPAGPGRIGGRRLLPRWLAGLLGLAVVLALGFLGYHLVSGSRQGSTLKSASRNHVVNSGRSANPDSGRSASPSPTSTGSGRPYADKAVVELTVRQRCWVEVTTTGGRRLFRQHLAGGTSRTWTFRRPVDLTLSDPSSVSLIVDGRNPLPASAPAGPMTLRFGPGGPATVSVRPRPSPSPSVRTLTAVRAAAFGPGGEGQGDNPQLAHLAINGTSATGWHTDWYTSAQFGNLYAGTGLILDMGRQVTITSVRVTLGSAPGATFQVRVGAAPSLPHLPVVATATSAHGVVSLRLTTPAHGRYVLIWFTKLPPDPAGTFQASVHQVTVDGRG